MPASDNVGVQAVPSGQRRRGGGRDSLVTAGVSDTLSPALRHSQRTPRLAIAQDRLA